MIPINILTINKFVAAVSAVFPAFIREEPHHIMIELRGRSTLWYFEYISNVFCVRNIIHSSRGESKVDIFFLPQ